MVRFEFCSFFRQGQFLMPPGALPGSLFEVILAPSWRQVGSKGGFWGLENRCEKNMKKGSPKKGTAAQGLLVWGAGKTSYSEHGLAKPLGKTSFRQHGVNGGR